MPQPETYRTFIALPLSPKITKKLADVQRALHRRSPERAVSWVKPANIHVTLFFLGDILPTRQKPIEKALSVVARNVRPFMFDVQNLGAFPNVDRPRVIWVGVDEPTGQLALLHSAVNEAMESVGFQPENRRFSPHLTVGRIRRRASRDEPMPWASGPASRSRIFGEVPSRG